MKTVAEFKRAVKVGAFIRTTHHQKFAGRDSAGAVLYKDEEMPVATVSIVQATQFAVARKRSDGKTVDSWCKFPKATECRFENGGMTILETDYRTGSPTNGEMVPILTYWILPEEERKTGLFITHPAQYPADAVTGKTHCKLINQTTMINQHKPSAGLIGADIQWTNNGLHEGEIIDKLLKDGSTVYLVEEKKTGEILILAPEMVHTVNA